MLLYLFLALPMPSPPCDDAAPSAVHALSVELLDVPLENCADVKSRGFCEHPLAKNACGLTCGCDTIDAAGRREFLAPYLFQELQLKAGSAVCGARRRAR